jgi:hypothetical protein
MAKFLVKIEKIIDAELPNEASAKFRKSLAETVLENPDRLLVEVDRLRKVTRKPNLPAGNAGY